MFLCLNLRYIKESENYDRKNNNSNEYSSNINAVMLMMIPMFVMGLIYNSVQGIMPKLTSAGKWPEGQRAYRPWPRPSAVTLLHLCALF